MPAIKYECISPHILKCTKERHGKIKEVLDKSPAKSGYGWALRVAMAGLRVAMAELRVAMAGLRVAGYNRAVYPILRWARVGRRGKARHCPTG